MKKIVLLIFILGIAACSNNPQPPTYKNAARVPVNVTTESEAEAEQEAADIDVIPD